MYKNKSFAEPSYVNKKTVMKMLETRQKNSHAMKSQVLSEGMDIDPVSTNDKLKPLQGFLPANHSGNGHFIKAQYDKVKLNQQSNLSTLHQNQLNQQPFRSEE